MHDVPDATATELRAQAAAPARHSRLIQLAPGPETPDRRDKAGAQQGMVVLLVGGGLFWAAVGALALFLLR